MASSLLQTDVAPHPILAGRAIVAKLEGWLEAERERIGLWVPVGLGLGILAWIALLSPAQWVAWIMLCCGMAVAALGLMPGGRARAALAGLGLSMAAGCVLIWAKALLVGEPPLTRAVHTAFTARVIAVESQPALGRARLLLAPEDASLGLPAKVRINIADKDMPPAEAIGRGARIAVRARLLPPAEAAVPGAYDFAVQAYFSGIGATGKALPPVRVIAAARPDGVAAMRADLSRHINGQLQGGAGSIAVALATGDRGGISEADEDAMRRSGLAHLLSISGLHVSALIAAVILIVYRLLALSPFLALRLHLMLISAGAGALAGIGYTLFTGAQVPTVRSCIAALLVLAGLAMGREAISLRLVAVGACAVLLFWPEAVIGPSFQMSFAAVTVIIALAESRWFRSNFQAREEGALARAWRHLAAVLVTGLAVEVALMPIALAHFHQAGALGAFANLIAIPLTTFVIMPTEAAALALDLIGLGAPFWWITGQALSLLLAVAHGVARSPAAIWALPEFGRGAFAILMFGGLWLILWTTRARLLGLVPMAAGAMMMALAPAPDLLVTGDGRHMAVRQEDGSLALLRGRAGEYVRDMLERSAGIGEMFSPEQTGDSADEGRALQAADERMPGAGQSALASARNARCSRDLCSVLVRGRERDWLVVATYSKVRLPWRVLIDLCVRADIVVSDRRLPAACTPRWLKLDHMRLKETGGVAIYLDSERWISVRAEGDRHPWISRPPQMLSRPPKPQ